MIKPRHLLFAVACFAAADDLPKFDQYKVTEKFTGKPAAPILTTRSQKNYRAVIVDTHRLNFAGHYTLAQWGCGAGCVSLAIIDDKTGRTFDAPFNVLGYDLNYTYEGGEDQVEFRPDSRLIIARGCPGEKDCGTYYYEWVNDTFKLIRKKPAENHAVAPTSPRSTDRQRD